MWQVLDLVGDLLFAVSAVGVTTFAVLYGTRSRWRATPAGRVTFGFMTVVASIMISAILFGLLWPEGYERQRLVVRVALYGALAGAIVHYIVVLLRAQRADRRERRQRPGG